MDNNDKYGANQQYNAQNNVSPSQSPRGAQPSGVSKGEMFLGLNILSKIGVIFILIGVIAFSATSEDYLSGGVRMALVAALGAIMLVVGEIFLKKGSVIFGNTLIYGGLSELFIATLVGRYGFEVFSPEAVQLIGLGVSALAIALSVYHKSQAMMIVTLVGASLPIYGAKSLFSVLLGAVCIVAVDCALAIIARKREQTVFNITASCFICYEMILTLCVINFATPLPAYVSINNMKIAVITAVVFMFCCSVFYAGGALLNAAASDGSMSISEIIIVTLTQSFLILVGGGLLRIFVSTTATWIMVGALAVIYIFCIAAFSMNYTWRCTASNLLINLTLGLASYAVLILFKGTAQYAAFHILGILALVFGTLCKRTLLRGWSYGILGTAEISFFVVIGSNLTRITSDPHINLTPCLLNIGLWLAVMIFCLVSRKFSGGLLSAFTVLVMTNTGVVGSAVIIHDLFAVMRDSTLCMLFAACLWMALGFAAGKIKPIGNWGMGSSIGFYAVSFVIMMITNVAGAVGNKTLDALLVIATIIVNILSVLTVLDLTAQITKKAPKFAKAVGLIVSAYGVMVLTLMLGINDFVNFTSFVISILYIVTAAVWIVIGFKTRNALLRRFGLALSLLASGKLFLFDFSQLDQMGRTLMFIGFGVTLLAIAFGYGYAEKKLKDKNNG